MTAAERERQERTMHHALIARSSFADDQRRAGAEADLRAELQALSGDALWELQRALDKLQTAIADELRSR